MSASPSVLPRELTPRADRYPATFSVGIKGPTTAPFRCLVRNLSSSGMLVEDGGRLSVGDAISIDLPGGASAICTVVRRRGTSVGLKSLSPIALDRLI